MSIQIVPDYRIKTSRELVETIREPNGKNYCFILGSGASVESGIRAGNTLGYLWMEDLEKESKFDVIKNLSDSFKKDGKINHEVDQIIAAY